MESDREEAIYLHDVQIAGVFNQQVKLHVPEWTAYRGEFWVIGGFHGSGKTDLINVLAGLQSPTSGLVRVLGHSIEGLHGDELLEHRRRIGVVFENGGRLFSRLNIFENMALPLQYHSDIPAEEIIGKVAEVMTWTGLAEFGNRRPEALNMSWQQRAALARALMLEPEILLFDRPFGGLELRHRRWWHDFLCRLSSGKVYKSGRKVTLVITTDDVYPWMEYASHFAILKERRMSVIGNASQFKEQQELRDMWETVTPE